MEQERDDREADALRDETFLSPAERAGCFVRGIRKVRADAAKHH
jgi:hypothetical protein